MTNFTLKGLLSGWAHAQVPVPIKKGMTADIRCDGCGTIFKRWSVLAHSSTLCEECLAKLPTAH
ncbi:hypothetical protein A6U87_13980 [Rhizobium sp. AC44/96]|uniref:hypothetical protein n=1 Tax=unclassified Rhizobium TaxID=2613769 RepID=UPI00080FF1E8|nr:MULTISPECIES: hypothetical protein [unclassified Rhizobium]MDM9620950.1 hypothetical protein [Rhizobium sp. S96]OCJ05127.1 hypothetical protein A6U87_13980 [Rhizobium sp. AC44/96]